MATLITFENKPVIIIMFFFYVSADQSACLIVEKPYIAPPEKSLPAIYSNSGMSVQATPQFPSVGSFRKRCQVCFIDAPREYGTDYV
jgi:hypothetical protein